ncbi:signal peptidase II [Dysosmobacter sp.]|uniref:signal peptidase II n=1 Tax=Dysosmobacter sp. TaxID=2591382 RepID=UPI002A9E22A3|nr:signal peptidase II [Dysosmobacter sp.]MCI6054359.1 signal peptidase II [Dysosmobacter sp.]MDY5510035.1 signal peptidase II [Dysosmobacter sp.]
MITLLTAALTLSACTLARWYLERPGRRERSALGGRIKLTALWNRGAAFGLPLGREALMALSALVLGVTVLFRRRSPFGAGLVLGGGLSNLWERLRYGKVLDYLRFPAAPGKLKKYVYNLADLALFLGALWLALFPREK